MKTIKQLSPDATEVTTLQRQLQRLGYAETQLGPHGQFTAPLTLAVKQFQQTNGLTPDGIVGYDTWEALFFAQPREAHATTLTDAHYALAARLADCPVAALRAVAEVETGGRKGFVAQGRPTILFEGHIFWRELQRRGINPTPLAAKHPDLVYPRWTKQHYLGGAAEYGRLLRARAVHREAADAATSWGLFQVMGFNHALCDEPSVSTFVSKMSLSAPHQLLLTLRYLRRANLLPHLRCLNWCAFARAYNGPSYALNAYDRKLEQAYRKWEKKG